jgi:urease accessory protein
MIHIDKIIGNINSDSHLKDRYQYMLKSDHVERIEISRLESERSRIRKVSDKGTDLVLTMIPGSHINDGDVFLLTEEKMVIAKRVSENVAIISLKENISADQLFETAIKIGHTIGNMHRPIKIANGKIYFPIQAQSEIELFQKLFSNLRYNLDIKSENIIFEPQPGYDVHGH